MVTFEEMKKKFDEYGYYAEDELLYEAYNALYLFEGTEVDVGQDIYAVCLEGPPGAGKTEFARVYTKIVNSIFHNVEMVEYQCDATTGKNELNEDVNMAAAIRHDADNVIIPGKLVTTINKVNEGKKVVLFLDEYDKAREETDAFLLQFLQDGKLNAVQCGDLEIKKEFKHNLEVILCKNDMREELSGPLSRRVRIIRLDYMKPNVFYEVAKKKLDLNDSLINLVSLMYELAYNNKDLFNRLPSCSEMLLALSDTNRLIKYASIPKKIIYNRLIKGMFKNQDDLISFESVLEGDIKFKELVTKMKEDSNTADDITINSLISSTIFKDNFEEVNKKINTLQTLINNYQLKFKDMEEQRRKAIDEEIKQIRTEFGKLVSQNIPDTINIFEDQSYYVRRGINIFNTSQNEWYQAGYFKISKLSHHLFVKKICEFAKDLNIFVYENGFKIENNPNLIVTCCKDGTDIRYEFYTDMFVVPAFILNKIEKFINLASDALKYQNQDLNIDKEVSISAFVYNEEPLNNCKQIIDNVYELESINYETLKELNKVNLSSNINNSSLASQTILNSKKKVLKSE